jgi:thioredoxin 1
MTFEEFTKQLQESERPVVVDVWAPWCAPCRTLSPRLDEVGSSFVDQVAVWKINADESPALTRALGVMGIPTLIFYKEGVEVTRRTGVQSIAALRQLFDMLVDNEAPAPVTGMGDQTRMLRLISGLALWAIAAFTGWSPVLLIVGGLIIFSGIHDRCPLWQAVKERLRGSPLPTAK